MKSKFEKNRIFLTRIVGVAVLFLILSTQSQWETKNMIIGYLLFFFGIVFAAVASLGRMWCSLYIAGYKNNKLITEGPYSISRNPLYFFSMIGVIGIGFATKTFTFPLLFIILFVPYYILIIKSEEKRLKEYFGAEFEEYTRRVPALFPNFSTFHEPDDYNVKPSVYRTHILSAVWFVWAVGILELINGMKEIGLFTPLWSFY